MDENRKLQDQYNALDSQKFMIDTQVPNLHLYETQVENRLNEVGMLLEAFEAPYIQLNLNIVF